MPSSFPPPKKVLVTGAAGFIGSRVCVLLREHGVEVVGLDNFSDSYDMRLKDWRWAQLEKLSSLELHRLDLVDKEGLTRLFQRHARAPFEAVINLAARAGVRASVENPSIYVAANVSGSLNLLEMCRQFGVKKFTLASTSSLYGKDHPTPYREDLNTDHPLSPYAATKRQPRRWPTPTTICTASTSARCATSPCMGRPAGPTWHRSVLCSASARAGRSRSFGDGSQSRDFTYVDDIARGDDRGTAAHRLRGLQSRLRRAAQA